MEAEDLIETFDRGWFELDIFDTCKRKRTSVHGKLGDENLSIVVLRDPEVFVRSVRDRLATPGRSFSRMGSASPDSVLLSRMGRGPGIEEDDGTGDRKKERRRLVRRDPGTMSKSLSELEFQEVKGFMDLGFVFSEVDKDTSLAELIPGLHRLGKRDAGEEGDVKKQQTSETVQRPYLSESWDCRKDEEYLLRLSSMHWEVSVSGDTSDIKRSLRTWARNVASVVRTDFFSNN